MDRFEAMKIFVRVAELQSFTKTAEILNLPKASVSNYIQDLENTVNTKLLNRTTRHVELTNEGMIFYERCKDILSDIDETESMFTSDSNIKGKIRVDMTIGMANALVIPLIPKFMEQHPDIEIDLSSTDRRVDLIKEGIDCVIRAGSSSDIGLVEKKLGEMVQVNCVSREYISKYGKPETLNDLVNHKLIYYSPVFGMKPHGFEYFDGEKYTEFKMNGSFTVNNTYSYFTACLSGLGIAQFPLLSAGRYFESGELVEILPEFKAKPLELNLIYPYRRRQSKRVHVFLEWLIPIIKEYIR